MNRMKRKTILREDTHSLHIEDSLLMGRPHIRRMNTFFKKLFSIVDGSIGINDSNPAPTIKWDGAPAIMMFSHTEKFGGPGVSTKSLFNANPKVYLTEADIENDNRGEELSNKLKWSLKLAQSQIIPKDQIWHGDLLWVRGDQQSHTENGESFIYVQPNTLVYAAPSDSDLGKKIKKSDIGIVFHTRYLDKDGRWVQSNDISISELQNIPSWAFVIDAKIPNLAGKVSLSHEESAELKNMMSELESISETILDYDAYDDLIKNESFINFYIMTLQNKKVDNDEAIIPEKFCDDLYAWIDQRLTKDREKASTLKTERGRSRRLDVIQTTENELISLVRENENLLFDIAKGLSLASEIKNILIDQMEKANEWVTRVETRSSGFKNTKGEGFVISDIDGNFVKLVDRSTFSYFNRSPDVIKGWDSDKRRRHFRESLEDDRIDDEFDLHEEDNVADFLDELKNDSLSELGDNLGDDLGDDLEDELENNSLSGLADIDEKTKDKREDLQKYYDFFKDIGFLEKLEDTLSRGITKFKNNVIPSNGEGKDFSLKDAMGRIDMMSPRLKDPIFKLNGSREFFSMSGKVSGKRIEYMYLNKMIDPGLQFIEELCDFLGFTPGRESSEGKIPGLSYKTTGTRTEKVHTFTFTENFKSMSKGDAFRFRYSGELFYKAGGEKNRGEMFENILAILLAELFDAELNVEGHGPTSTPGFIGRSKIEDLKKSYFPEALMFIGLKAEEGNKFFSSDDLKRNKQTGYYELTSLFEYKVKKFCKDVIVKEIGEDIVSVSQIGANETKRGIKWDSDDLLPQIDGLAMSTSSPLGKSLQEGIADLAFETKSGKKVYASVKSGSTINFAGFGMGKLSLDEKLKENKIEVTNAGRFFGHFFGKNKELAQEVVDAYFGETKPFKRLVPIKDLQTGYVQEFLARSVGNGPDLFVIHYNGGFSTKHMTKDNLSKYCEKYFSRDSSVLIDVKKKGHCEIKLYTREDDNRYIQEEPPGAHLGKITFELKSEGARLGVRSSKNTIINDIINESFLRKQHYRRRLSENKKQNSAVVCFGRFNPPTIGHVKLIRQMWDLSQEISADCKVFLSSSYDGLFSKRRAKSFPRNPLDPELKKSYLIEALENNGLSNVEVNVLYKSNLYSMLHDIYEQGYNECYLFGGEDRVAAFEEAINYNGSSKLRPEHFYNFDIIDIMDAGKRNELSDDIEETASASLVRKLVIENDFETFKKYVVGSEATKAELFQDLEDELLGNE